jgi:hypothetical protein
MKKCIRGGVLFVFSHERKGHTTMSTVSNKLRTTPSSSTIGTALIPRSEKTCTTSNTLVCIVAVDRGQNRSETPRLAAAPASVSCGSAVLAVDEEEEAAKSVAVVVVEDAERAGWSDAAPIPVGVVSPPPCDSLKLRGGNNDCRLESEEEAPPPLLLLSGALPPSPFPFSSRGSLAPSSTSSPADSLSLVLILAESDEDLLRSLAPSPPSRPCDASMVEDGFADEGADGLAEEGAVELPCGAGRGSAG